LLLLTIVIPYAGIGVHHFCGYLKEKHYGEAWNVLAVYIVFLVLAFLPVRGTGDVSAYYNTHAIVINARGLETEAMQYWEASSRMQKPYSAFANLSLAGKYLKWGDTQEALKYLGRIPDRSFAAARKYALLGDVMFTKKDIKSAVESYEKSLSINSGQRDVRAKLVKIFEKIDQRRAAMEYEKLAYISSYYDML
jgi:tetratricopeptide (TPR) repeat protein